MPRWTARDIPPQQGRVALVTGATGGIGFEVARALAASGAEVLLAVRDAVRAEAAMERIAGETPGARLAHVPLDLAALRSVRGCAEAVAARHGTLDLLVNVAGIMAVPRRRLTADGFEAQLGVNFLGHFALTGLLLPLLRRAAAPRVTCVTSLAYRFGRVDIGDLQSARAYRPWGAYAQSKLALLSFSLELQRRSDAGGWGVASIAAHPGWAVTNLYAKGPASEGTPRFLVWLMHRSTRLFAHSAEVAARPVLFAATAPEAEPGGHYGRRWLGEMRGPPAPARITAAARDGVAAARLWCAAERLTGVRFPAA